MSEYENIRTADIVAEALMDWNVEVIFGLPGNGKEWIDKQKDLP